MPTAGRSGPNMTNIRAIMVEEILRSGSISFARFMELAMYCPNFGYYERLDTAPGRRGDFITSVSVGALFGEMLAFQFAEWLGMLPAQPRHIVEAGAHDGSLARDILSWLQGHRPELFRSLEYWILEPSLRRRESQQKTLGEFTRTVRWFDSWTDLPPAGVRGVIFTNELLDALPTHRLGWDAARKKWFPWGVTLAGENLVWTRMPEGGEFDIHAANRAEKGLPWNLPPDLIEVLPDGFSTELCPGATEWWRGAARALKCGKLMTLDYGLMEEEFFTPERKEGTLRSYFRHHQSGDLFANVGEQDITSHVNFTALMNAGVGEGLRTESWTTQGQFLEGILEGMFAKSTSVRDWASAHARQFQTLTHPEHLGRSFRVLVQAR
jgi:SAM-dependent MidA family methyltransferase